MRRPFETGAARPSVRRSGAWNAAHHRAAGKWRWTGTAAQLLANLKQCVADKVVLRSPDWPPNARRLSSSCGGMRPPCAPSASIIHAAAKATRAIAKVRYETMRRHYGKWLRNEGGRPNRKTGPSFGAHWLPRTTPTPQAVEITCEKKCRGRGSNPYGGNPHRILSAFRILVTG